MKNKHIEYLRAAAKKHKKTVKNDSRWDHTRGIKIYHVYDPDEPREYSWWDDTMFIQGSQAVVVFFIHPRMQYKDLCESAAHKQCPSPRDDSWLTDGEITYRYLGKNKKRKRVAYSTMSPMSGSMNAWIDRLRETEHKILTGGDLVAKPSMVVTQLSYARCVDICVPMEVRNEDDLQKLVADVKEYLSVPGLFEQRFSDYSYTKEDWIREGLDK